jgi:glycosyltransferase involved in cell wall biosynthesis
VTLHHVTQAHGGLHFGDFYEFAEALTLLLDDAGLRGRLAAQGRAYVEREYSWPTVTERLRDTLERVIA